MDPWPCRPWLLDALKGRRYEFAIRAAVPSILIMLSASLWFLLAQDVGSAANLGTELEDAVFAPAYAAIEETW